MAAYKKAALATTRAARKAQDASGGAAHHGSACSLYDSDYSNECDSAPATFAALPAEVVAAILRHLPPPALGRATCVCRLWRDASRDSANDLWGRWVTNLQSRVQRLGPAARSQSASSGDDGGKEERGSAHGRLPSKFWALQLAQGMAPGAETAGDGATTTEGLQPRGNAAARRGPAPGIPSLAGAALALRAAAGGSAPAPEGGNAWLGDQRSQLLTNPAQGRQRHNNPQQVGPYAAFCRLANDHQPALLHYKTSRVWTAAGLLAWSAAPGAGGRAVTPEQAAAWLVYGRRPGR